MKRFSYRDQDYAFGQSMLTLRSNIGLTQAGLAEFLGVSRRSVADWEAGGKYPKAKHLQALIELAVQQKAFPAGKEANEIRGLWKASHQKVLLDEGWLNALLKTQTGKASSLPVSNLEGTQIYWDNALSVQTFYGREWERDLLTKWIVEERCQVASILGMGGMGKSALAVNLMHQLAPEFEIVIWRSLRDLPTCDVLLADLLQILVPPAVGESADTFEQRLNLLMDQLRAHRILLVLDNVESVLEENEINGRMRPGYEGFGRFLRQCAETRHQSSVLLTSRQKPDELVRHEGSQTPVRTLRLVALDTAACEQLLTEREVIGSAEERTQLIQAYAGNPLALKIVAQTIIDLFGGHVGPFLEQGGMIFGGVRELLYEQYKRLSPLERRIAFWLAIMREPITFNQLQALFVVPLPRTTALEIVNGMYRHSLIERGKLPGSFTLQSVVLEYFTEQLVMDACDEILRGELGLLLQHGLEQAQVEDYVRNTQTRLLIEPLLMRLQNLGQGDLEVQLYQLLDKLRQSPVDLQGYGPANIVALLRELRGHLRQVDLSQLVLRGVYLQGVNMQDCKLTNALLRDCVFAEDFGNVQSLSISGTGDYWAIANHSGEIQVYEAGGYVLYRRWWTKNDWVARICLSPDGRLLAGGSMTGMCYVWEVATGALVWSSENEPRVGYLNQLVFSPNGHMLATSCDRGVWLWDVTLGKLLAVLLHDYAVPSIAWHADSNLIVSGDAVGTIRFWAVRDEPSDELVMTIEGHESVVTSVAFSPDFKQLVSGSWDGAVKVWNVADGSFVETLHKYPNAIQRMAWSADGEVIACSVRDDAIWLWDVEQRRYRAKLQGHTAFVRGLAFTPDGRQLVSGSEDNTIRIWDTVTGSCMRIIYGYRAGVIDIAWNPEGTQLVSSGTEMVLRLYSVTDSAPPRVLAEHTHNSLVTWSPDGRFIAGINLKNVIYLWDGQTGEALQSLSFAKDRGDYIQWITWSPDGKRLVAGTGGHGIQIFDMATRSVNPFGDVPLPRIETLFWSPDGKMIAVNYDSSTVGVWDANTGTAINQAPGKYWMWMAWSSDSKRLALVEMDSEGGKLWLWDVASGEVVHLCTYSQMLVEMVWMKNDELIATVSNDGILAWWDVQTGECIRQVQTNQGKVNTLRMSADERWLATSSEGGEIVIRDSYSGEVVKPLRRDRPYERVDITGIRGLTDAQKVTLLELGAVEN